MKESLHDKENKIANEIISGLTETLIGYLVLNKNEENFFQIVELSLICFITYIFKKLYDSSQLEENLQFTLNEYKEYLIKVLSESINLIE